MSTDQPTNQSTSSSQPDEEAPTGETEPGHREESPREGSPGKGSPKEVRPIYLRPANEKELGRVVAARGGYKSVPHLLREYLSRSLIPRIREGRCFPGRLLAETTGRASSGASGKSPAGGSAKGQAGSRAHETPEHIVCRLLLEKKNNNTLTVQKFDLHKIAPNDEGTGL